MSEKQLKLSADGDVQCGTLLEQYYDPKYLHKLKSYKSEMLNIDADDLDRAVLRLEVLADQVLRE